VLQKHMGLVVALEDLRREIDAADDGKVDPEVYERLHAARTRLELLDELIEAATE
jgi:hypothetical protein